MLGADRAVCRSMAGSGRRARGECWHGEVLARYVIALLWARGGEVLASVSKRTFTKQFPTTSVQLKIVNLSGGP